MNSLVLILGDQLSHSISSLEGLDKENDIVLMCEVIEEASYVKHHKKKIAFIFSAMRHFAEELQLQGYHVEYTKLDDANNMGSFHGEVKRIINARKFDQIVVTEPGEFRVLKDMLSWQDKFTIPVIIRTDKRFLCTTDEFATWASGRKQLRMEYFYREMRQKYTILMEGDQPVGGQWNYDSENRKFPNEQLNIPATFHSKIDDITSDVIGLVSQQFGEHVGDLEPFHFAVTRKQALQALEQFIEDRLSCFGDYQDAMIQGEPWLYHSHLSFYLNCGLLLPMECVQAAEQSYYDGKAPLNAVEGFIRQIIGWREYVRGIYWLKMPDYASHNFFDAHKNLPSFYWTADTKMNCLSQCVSETIQNAYAHHIQRLMVLGNFALLAGIEPAQVNEWFLTVYADAFEWVELPNVSGMILFADGGYLASKPYAAGGAYINKMSNYCKTCSYSVHKKNGKGACPFNYLYWHFLAKNRDKLNTNHRLMMMYKTYDRMSDDKKTAIDYDSLEFLASIE
ncbi:MAG: cryptochrome/photolyase family protein [Gammaproteobacteria bacterium]|nr:cryptochrome/photolyase family protein [Gammaproteobacteria bacterium]